MIAFFLCNCLFLYAWPVISWISNRILFCLVLTIYRSEIRSKFHHRATCEVGSLWIWKFNFNKNKSFPLSFSQILAFSWVNKTWNETSASSRIYQISLKASQPFLSFITVTCYDRSSVPRTRQGNLQIKLLLLAFGLSCTARIHLLAALP